MLFAQTAILAPKSAFSAYRFMKHNDTQKFGSFLKGMTTERLEGLLSKVLREMRQRDSKRMTGDAISTSQELRSLRATSSLPKR